MARLEETLFLKSISSVPALETNTSCLIFPECYSGLQIRFYMKSLCILLWFSLITYSMSAPIAPACAGGSPATSCANACINCNFNGYAGSTAGFPSGIVPNFCGTVENAQWMGFIAGAGNATFTVVPSVARMETAFKLPYTKTAWATRSLVRKAN